MAGEFGGCDWGKRASACFGGNGQMTKAGSKQGFATARDACFLFHSCSHASFLRQVSRRCHAQSSHHRGTNCVPRPTVQHCLLLHLHPPAFEWNMLGCFFIQETNGTVFATPACRSPSRRRMKNRRSGDGGGDDGRDYRTWGCCYRMVLVGAFVHRAVLTEKASASE